MFKKILSSFLVIALLCSISITIFGSSSSLGDNHTFDQMIPLEIQEAMENQAEALEEYFELIGFFKKDNYGVPIYPQHYAGEYINKDNKLVVQLTGEFADKEILSYLKSSPNIQIIYVEHSYDELISQKKIADKLYASGVRVVSDGVDIIDNRYKIAVLKEDLDKMATTYTKDSLVIFEEGTYARASAPLIGGDRIYNEDSGGFMSIGICGTYNGNDAILTCGHGNEKVGIFSPRYPYIEHKTQSHRIGQVVFQQANTDSSNYGVSSLGDFAIVDITSSDTITNDVWQGGQITGTYSSVPVGTTVYKFGSRTGYAWGNVTGTSLRISYTAGLFTTYTVSGLYSIPLQNSSGTNAINGGDSGGPVWRSDTGENLIHGIVTAGIYDTNLMYTTPIYYAQHQGFQPKLD
ncbi:trypsin-like serine protease [Vallitalea pronyensis]|uniref:Trypsin-like serine protease n=1 Tax=Vallitalea pronyensis TaxID=1348613 RepID=A0A8J8MJS7_9FIRM|nr:trypsin-like serine protease [Vallitalea pronyensis]QUI22741.1 trypsin-like serine protease [Vallitalea pronyensis]